MNHKDHAPPTFGHSKLQNAGSEPGDEQQGEWSREQLLRMDHRYIAAVERAIAKGKEHRPRP